MMGSTKLGKIRAELRQAFALPDAELFAWFNRQLGDRGQEPNGHAAELATLRLLRDALVKETQRGAPRRRAPRPTGRSKN